MASDMYDALMQIAEDIGRPNPSFRDAEAFHELRSSIRRRVRSLADSPLAVRTVVRPLKIEVPVKVPVLAPMPAMLELSAGGMKAVLNTEELAALFHRRYERSGGWPTRFRKWHVGTDHNTGVLVLTRINIHWIWQQGSGPWKDNHQKRTHTIFWRSRSGMFTSLGMKESRDVILPTYTGRRQGPSLKPPRWLLTAATPQVAKHE
jgi:hypothetical protein